MTNQSNKKFELIKDYITYRGHKLYRIRALRNFGDVKKGDVGGYIEKEDNLSHKGSCWVGGDVKVYGNAKVNGYTTNNYQIKQSLYNFLYTLTQHYSQLPSQIKSNIHYSFKHSTDYYNYTGIDLSYKSSIQKQRQSMRYTIEEYIDAIYHTIIKPFIKHRHNIIPYIYFHIPSFISDSIYQEELFELIYQELNCESYYTLLNDILQQFPSDNVIIQYNYLINHYIQQVLEHIDLYQLLGNYLDE